MEPGFRTDEAPYLLRINPLSYQPSMERSRVSLSGWDGFDALDSAGRYVHTNYSEYVSLPALPRLPFQCGFSFLLPIPDHMALHQ